MISPNYQQICLFDIALSEDAERCNGHNCQSITYDIVTLSNETSTLGHSGDKKTDSSVLFHVPAVDDRIEQKGVAGCADDGAVSQLDCDGPGLWFDIISFHDTVVH